eukprot:1479967-Rhodomonas_salina.1
MLVCAGSEVTREGGAGVHAQPPRGSAGAGHHPGALPRQGRRRPRGWARASSACGGWGAARVEVGEQRVWRSSHGGGVVEHETRQCWRERAHRLVESETDREWRQ